MHFLHHAHAAFREVGRELAVGRDRVDEVVRHPLDEVVLAVEEREPARLVLLDHEHLDAPDDREALAPDRADHLFVPRFARGGVEHRFAEIRVRLQDDSVGAPPALEHEGAGADGMRADVLAVELDHLAGERAELHVAHEVRKVVVLRREADLQRVLVGRLQPFDRRVVVEAAELAPALHQRIEPGDLALEQIEVRRLQLRVEEPLDGERVVGGDELAALAAESRIGREVDAWLHAKRVRQSVARHRGQRLRGVRIQLRRPREVVIVDEEIEDVAGEHPRVDVLEDRRIESAFGELEGDAQRLAHVGGSNRQRRRRAQRDEESTQAATRRRAPPDLRGIPSGSVRTRAG